MNPTAVQGRFSPLYLAIVTAVTIIPVSMGLMDVTITNVAFGIVAGALNVSIDEIAGISTAYALAMLIAMPLAGWLSTNLTRKASFLGAIALFTLASIGCAFSHSIEQLIVARFVQGLGAGVMQTLSAAALLDVYPKEQHAKAFQIWGIGVMVGPFLGPILGGWLLSNFPWQSVFLINVPFGILSVVLGVLFLPQQSERGERSAFSWTSLAFMFVGLAALLYVLQEGAHQDWFSSGTIVTASIVGVVMLSIFVSMQFAMRSPLVNLRPLRIPSYSIGLILAIVSGVGVTGSAFVMPLFYQNVLGFDIALTGFGMLPSAIGVIVGIQLAGTAWARRIPPAILTAVSLLLLAVGSVWFALMGGNATFEQTLLPRGLQGLGSGLFYVPLNVLLIRDVPTSETDAAVGLSGVCRQLGISIGYAGISAILAKTQAAALIEYGNRVRGVGLTANLRLSPIRDWLSAHGWSAADASAYALPVFQQFVARSALTAAYDQTLFWLAGFFVFSILATVLLWRRVSPRKILS